MPDSMFESYKNIFTELVEKYAQSPDTDPPIHYIFAKITSLSAYGSEHVRDEALRSGPDFKFFTYLHETLRIPFTFHGKDPKPLQPS
jgi:hypothetical protein